MASIILRCEGTVKEARIEVNEAQLDKAEPLVRKDERERMVKKLSDDLKVVNNGFGVSINMPYIRWQALKATEGKEG